MASFFLASALNVGEQLTPLLPALPTDSVLSIAELVVERKRNRNLETSIFSIWDLSPLDLSSDKHGNVQGIRYSPGGDVSCPIPYDIE